MKALISNAMVVTLILWGNYRGFGSRTKADEPVGDVRRCASGRRRYDAVSKAGCGYTDRIQDTRYDHGEEEGAGT